MYGEDTESVRQEFGYIPRLCVQGKLKTKDKIQPVDEINNRIQWEE